MNVIIEGTDGIGKTETIKILTATTSHTYQDRNRDVISANMLFDITMEDRINAYCEFIANNDVFIVFLVNNDGDELMRRIKSRGKDISEFDLDAPKYNDLYRETFNQMASRGLLHGKMAMVDVTGMTLDEQVFAVKHLIDTAGFKEP